MPHLAVDDVSIPYEIRRSRRARRIRIVVRPGRVTVVAPWFVRSRTIEALVSSKRLWILSKTRALDERGRQPIPERFVSGERILFRGRWLRLAVEPGELSEPTLRFANAFHVQVPEDSAAAERELLARELVMAWLARRALDDGNDWARMYGPTLGAWPARIRLGDQKTLWGSCSPAGVVSLNWRLITAPRSVFEYVVVHELCHLVERNHGPGFWALVESLLPDYTERRVWLKKHGVALG